jgi:Uma2 family endonuclease
MTTLVALAPSLESGDRLSREEFWRRYSLRRDIKKAEYLEGKIYVASPLRSPDHGIPHGILMRRLGAYAEATPGVLQDDNATLRLANDDVQPDVMLRYGLSQNGGSRLDQERYVVGVPELVAEVAASSASYDLHEKKALYERTGIPEYIAWRVEDEAIDWFVLERGRYVPLKASDEGLTESLVFPGLALDLAAMLATFREALVESGLEP